MLFRCLYAGNMPKRSFGIPKDRLITVCPQMNDFYPNPNTIESLSRSSGSPITRIADIDFVFFPVYL
jgi:hypothetical protein